MRTSKEGLRLITQREGMILHGYKDSKGLLTIGVGHLVKKGEPYKLNQPITREESDRLLIADLAKAEAAVNSLGVDLSQNEFDALVSLTFNIGVGTVKPRTGFKGSTVARKLKAGDHNGAAEAILLWNKPPEIQGRRRGEYHQFKTPYKVAEVAKVGEVAEEKPAGTPATSGTPATPVTTEALTTAGTSAPIQVDVNGNDNQINLPDLSKTADVVTQQIPRIKTGARWLGTLGIGGGFATLSGAIAGLPPWAVFLLGMMTAIVFIGLIWLFVKYYGKVFGLVAKVLDINADPATNNVQLVSRREGE